MFGIETKDLWSLLLSLGAFITSVATWLRKPGEDAQESLRKHVSTDHADLKGKVMTLEERIRHMPTSDELTELEGTVKKVDERTAGLSEGLSAVRVQLNRIETFLLQNK